jgi:DNA polymerase-3 subunit epsilon
MSDTWIALDFETATRERSSACSLGVAIIENGVIASSESWLIQPPGNVYEPMNTRVHGIDEDHTAQSPSFADLYPTLWPYLHGQRIIAHWADFDVSVLRAVIAYHGLPTPATSYICSCRMAQRAFPELVNHRLPTVCAHCLIPLDHHDAGSDALACARVALSCRDRVGVASIHDALRQLDLQVGTL